jgi:hypothetical protein
MENLQGQGAQATAQMQMQQMTLPEPGDTKGLHVYVKERIEAIHHSPELPLLPDAVRR